MVEAFDMTVKFIERHPRDAANVLEFLPPIKACEILSTLSESHLLRITAQLAPDYMATCISYLSIDKKIQLFKQLETQTTVDIFRYLNNKEKNRLLNHIPFSKRLAIQTLNKYNLSSVGAWMNTDHFFVSQDKTVEEVIDLIHGSEQTNQDYVFLVNAKRQFVSTINTSQLLKVDTKLPINMIKVTSNYSLSARTAVQDVVKFEGWKHFTMLPVVELDKRLVGVLSYCDLMTAIDKSHAEFTARATNLGDEFFTLIWSLFDNFIQLLNAFFGIIARKK